MRIILRAAQSVLLKFARIFGDLLASVLDRLCTKSTSYREDLAQRRKGAKRYRVSKVFFASLRLCVRKNLLILVWLGVYLIFTTIRVMSSCCGAWPCHSRTWAMIFSAVSRADSRRDSTRIDRNLSSPNSIPTGLTASVTPSV